jgi:transcription elongation factor GreA
MEDQDVVYLTADGIKKLQEELDYLINVRRPEIARQIGEAKSDGDIAENAGYEEAKNAQAFAEGRILTLKNLLANAVVISETSTKELVEPGATVTIRDTQYSEEETYTIVGSAEVDPNNGRISLKSPIGQALMGHRVGDRVQVKTPDGLVQFEIVSIS